MPKQKKANQTKGGNSTQPFAYQRKKGAVLGGVGGRARYVNRKGESTVQGKKERGGNTRRKKEAIDTELPEHEEGTFMSTRNEACP